MKICDDIQERLAEAGPAVLRDDAEARRHVEGCADCAKVLEDLARLDAALEDLPSPDAPDALVAGTLEAVRRAARDQKLPARPTGRRRVVASALAATVVVVAAVGLLQTYVVPTHKVNMFSGGGEEEDVLNMFGRQEEVADLLEAESQIATRSSESLTGNRQFSTTTETTAPLAEAPEIDVLRLEGAGDVAAPELRKQAEASQFALDDSLAGGLGAGDEAERLDEESLLIARLQTRPAANEPAGLERGLLSEDKALENFEPEAAPVAGAKSKADSNFGGAELYRLDERAEAKHRAKTPAEVGAVGGLLSPSDAEAESSLSSGEPTTREFAPTSKPAKQKPYSLGQSLDLRAQDKKQEGEQGRGAFFNDGDSRRRSLISVELPEGPRQLAQDYLRRADSLEGLVFQEATGYWANTYIPGDPAMRLLQMRLRDWDRGVLGPALRLEQDVRQVGQPFDAPAQGAVALYLHAEKAAIEGPARLRVQVGLRGAERQGGHRPAMNLGLVIDPRALADAETGARLRALVTALEHARQPGDRFSLTLAGANPEMLVSPEDFRHGPLRVALERIFDQAPDLRNAAPDLPQAVSLAAESVRQGDDPNAILGSSLVLLATGSALDGELPALERLAHANAVGGLPLSVVSLGAGANLAEIDRLVAAGQGNRRILESPAAADALVDRELHAASRAVARALRLRIRLAPGVELVDVLGSRPLQEPQAERVREAEQAIDRRLARNLGIVADRGEDEDGIQIVIPNFYAGDSHVILLDVVAPGPGPIAEVQLRYKDVVRLRNGVAEASLAIGGGSEAAGPLERNVLKNLVARQLAGETRRAGRLLEAGLDQAATLILARQHDLIRGLRHEVPGWSGDPELAADEAVLADYLAALGRPAAQDALQRRYLADSLRYAAFRKLQTAAR